MPPRIKTSTTRLPSSLVDELNDAPSSDHPSRGGKRRGRPTLSRKDARKQDRTQKKQRKAEFFTSPSAKRHVEEEHEEAPQPKKVRIETLPGPPKAEKKLSGEAKKAAPKTETKKPTALEKMVNKSALPRTQKDTEDDRYIAYLESKLGYGKSRGNKPVDAEDDGLDDLLDFTSTIGLNTAEEDEEMPGSDNEEEEDGDRKALEDFGTTEDEETVGADGEEAEWGGIGSASVDERTNEPTKELTDDAPTTTAYVPPHLRNKASTASASESEELVKLRRNLKGLLNRMSEQNLASILDSVEELYRKHRRNDVTSTLTSLIIDGISSHSLLLDSYVVLHAAFISGLHKIIGIEFAASFVQSVVSTYENHYIALEDSQDGKECSNLLVLLSELYNFQVISCILLFDMIRGLLDGEMTEFKVELLLKFLKSSGQQLRTDDPSALKDITQIVQDKVAASSAAVSSRTSFMIETLTNLKNNKVKKAATQNQGGEAVERMKKFLSALGKKKHVVANEPLRVSLADLHSAETKGKWWLVGAAWGGDPLVDRQEDNKPAKQEVSTSNVLLKLARKQGMNTDIRRSIFVVLMSSDDYVDACDRLSQLNLTEIQQREIVRVLLHCCGNEKTYNPYYTLVCAHLCKTSHSYKITLQFCLWDFLRDLGETEAGGAEVLKGIRESGGGGESFDLKNISDARVRNVARAYAWWIAKDCVTLGILKPVDFTILKPQTAHFLSEFFVQLFVSSHVSTPMLRSNTKDLAMNKNRAAVEEIFIKATRVQALAMGLVYFFSTSFVDKDGDKFVKWAVEVAKDTLRTGVDIIPTL